MIDVTVLYPNNNDAKFDFAYWTGTHFPLLSRELGDALKGASAERGLAGGAPGSAAPWIAIARLRFDSVETFQMAFAGHAAAIMSDIPNYTNITPTIQISEILL